MIDLAALVVRKQLEAVVGGPHHGTAYSMTAACTRCGTGATQAGPLLIRPFRLPSHRVFLTLDYEVLVLRSLADELRQAGIGCLGPVVDAESGDELELAQLVPDATLPPFDGASTGVEREKPCPVCDRDGYYGIPHEPYRLCYTGLDPRLQEMELLATFERFGSSCLREPFQDSVFAAPVLIAGGRLLRCLEEARLRHLELQPVTVSWGAG